jgi:hypothetical protein
MSLFIILCREEIAVLAWIAASTPVVPEWKSPRPRQDTSVVTGSIML